MVLKIATGLIPAHAGKTGTGYLLVRNDGAHPRSRGENVTLSRSRSILTGSSPLTRGKRSRPRRRRRERGLIPAHAGKIAVAHGHLRRAAAHPRSRGENRRDRPPMESAPGSSPLTRGKYECDVCYLARSGLIPAHAGKITRKAQRRRSARAHPRSRGENAVRHRDRNRARWLIPAHAGKIRLHYASRPVYRAHPRSRGENTARTGRRRAVRGSSPLTRGKCRAQQLVGYGERLIPAHAGKMEASRRRPRTSGAHPRSRGENEIYNFAMKQCPGSSPLTRGKSRCRPLISTPLGLIPAHAGKIGGRDGNRRG